MDKPINFSALSTKVPVFVDRIRVESTSNQNSSQRLTQPNAGPLHP